MAVSHTTPTWSSQLAVYLGTIGASPRWNVIGVLGTTVAFLIGSYYTIVAGWVVAYAWKCGRGALAGLSRPAVQAEWANFIADPWQLMGWQALFLGVAAFIRCASRSLRTGTRCPAAFCSRPSVRRFMPRASARP